MDGELLDFGVSGKLRRLNLIMYDRQTESWWQEFGGEAIVGVYAGVKLEQLPMAMVSWSDFKASFPDGKVLSKPDTGICLMACPPTRGTTPTTNWASRPAPTK